MEAKTELQKNAVVEARRKELETYQRALDIQWLNSRMDDGGMGRNLALIQKEAEMEKDFQERTDHAAIVDARAKKEIDLGIQVAKARREEACELLRRHYLRERDPSLRELVKKLQAGYVRRDLQQQILHNEYKRLQEKAEENRSNTVLLNSLYNDKDEKDRADKIKMEKNYQYCSELQQQLVNKQRQRQCAYEETLIEKRMNDDVMKAIADEDQKELRHKFEQTEKLRKEMVTFQQARVAWKQKQKEINVIEDRKIEEQLKLLSDRSSSIVAERERKIQLKEESNEKITAKMLAEEAARREREDVITLLQQQEYLEKNVQDDIRERENFERVKNETKTALMTQMEARKNNAKEEKLREADFRKSVESKMAEKDEEEKKKERKKKEKSLQYFADLQKQIRDNAVRRKKEKEEEERRSKYQFEYDKAWRQEVSEERKKIMEDHVPKILGYVQPGVISHVDIANPRLADIDLISKYNDQDAKERTKKLKMEKNGQYCSELQQIVSVTNDSDSCVLRQRQSDYEERMIDKRVIDNVMQAIAEQDQRDLCQKRELTEKMRGEMVTFQQERVDLKQKMKELNMIEDRKIEEQVQFAIDRSSAWDAESKRKIQVREDEDEKISTKMLANVAARQEREDVKTLFQQHEYSEKSIQSDNVERGNYERARNENKTALLAQMEDKKNSVKEEKLREADFRKTVDTMLAEEDEEEREKQRKKKEKNDQYFADLQQQIQDNAARRKKEKEDEEKRCKEESEYDQGW